MKAITEFTADFKLFEHIIEQCNLNERQRRTMCACVAESIGYGGVAAVASGLNIDPKTVRKAMAEIKEGTPLPWNRLRAKGGGRKKLIVKQEGLLAELKKLLDDRTYGSPRDLICYTNLSLRKIKEHLAAKGFNISHTVVGEAIESLGYSKQRNRKLLQVGPKHPNRDAQFKFINAKGREWVENGLPLIYIDCKKKENLGNFSNFGLEYRQKGDPRQTSDHDFLIKELGKVAPYGVYVLNDNTGFVNLGTGSDTAEFAGESVKRRWLSIGKPAFNSNRLYIVCDSGGSNGRRLRLWKWVLAEIAQELNLEIHVSHLPPGTSKWNKIEHRLFCCITKNWEGKPLIDIETVIKLISSTTTAAGLKVQCTADYNQYQTGIKISDEELDTMDIERISDFPECNCIISGFKN